ncbi:MAG TPA: aldehyde dehydrogenase family protein, partial [Acidimicrobiia bacterium]|nr:aldehyde dehydrogenase family protein [Acidimicrobiia bacterium]
MPIGEAPLDVFPRPGLLIGDGLVTATTGGEYEHVYPATGKPTLRVPLAGPTEIDAAVQAARAAWPEWRSWTVDRRRDVMLRFAALVREHEEAIGRLSVFENGTPIRLAQTFVPTVADAFTYNAGWADKVGGDVIATWPVPALDYTVVEPYGVVGIIIPWNGPVPTIGMTIAPALAAGNTVVLKPSRPAPFSPLLAGRLLLEAGFPPGVVNVVPGGPEAGDALVRHPGVDKIHFMGSSMVARDVLAAALTNLTPVSLELGGKSANIIFADADLDAAAELAVSAIVLMSGQACLIGTRVLVEEAVYDDFVERCQVRVEQITVGDPALPSTLMGPLISRGACERVLGFIERAQANKEGRLVAGGHRLGGDLADGYFLAPTIFADVDNASELAQREIFGPLICIHPFSTEAEALSIANDHRYGLAAYIQTNDL